MPHVLLIEDDARIREIVERGLGSRGIVVTSAADGPAGLELARKLEVDVELAGQVEPGRPVLGRGDHESPGAEAALDDLPDAGVVFDQQNMGHRLGDIPSRRPTDT